MRTEAWKSVTLKAMKAERGLTPKDGLSTRRTYRLLNLSFFERKLRKIRQERQREHWRERELAEFGMSMQGLRADGQFEWV